MEIRGFLCGIDSYSGRDYSHRKAWILDRLRQLAGLFGVDICGYAVMSKPKNVMLLDWTGRELRRDKRGAIPDELAPILDRLGVDRSNWVETVSDFGRMFKQAAGRASSLVGAAPRASRRWNPLDIHTGSGTSKTPKTLPGNLELSAH